MLQESDERPPLWSASIFLRSVVEGGMKICFIHHYLSKHPSIHRGKLRFDSQECAGSMYSIPVYIIGNWVLIPQKSEVGLCTNNYTSTHNMDKYFRAPYVVV